MAVNLYSDLAFRLKDGLAMLPFLQISAETPSDISMIRILTGKIVLLIDLEIAWKMQGIDYLITGSGNPVESVLGVQVIGAR